MILFGGPAGVQITSGARLSLPAVIPQNWPKICGLTCNIPETLHDRAYVGCSLSVIKDYNYLLSQLKSQNLLAQCLDIIFQALILSKITYALPAFAGLISATFKSKINKFFHKAHRRGLVTTVFDIQSLIDKHDTHLFRSITYTDHCLHYLLPEKLNRSRNLRHRKHEYTLSHIGTTHLNFDIHM